MSNNRAFIASIIAFVIATSCCWLPAFVILVGGGSALMSLSGGAEKFSGVMMALGVGLLGLGLIQHFKRKEVETATEVILESTIKCPECGHLETEIMPTNACQYFYECSNCNTVLRPKQNDCCVYCSYGTVPCPPIQQDSKCC